MTEESICCDCCGAPYLAGDVWKVKEVEDATDKEFWLCESCEMKIKECGITSEQVNVFLADMSVIFDIHAMDERDLKSLSKIWSNWGFNCEDI